MYCEKLESIDLSNFNTQKVKAMEILFSNCDSLKSIYLSNFNMENVLSIKKMFYDCPSLSFINIYSFNNVSFSILLYFIIYHQMEQ